MNKLSKHFIATITRRYDLFPTTTIVTSLFFSSTKNRSISRYKEERLIRRFVKISNNNFVNFNFNSREIDDHRDRGTKRERERWMIEIINNLGKNYNGIFLRNNVVFGARIEFFVARADRRNLANPNKTVSATRVRCPPRNARNVSLARAARIFSADLRFLLPLLLLNTTRPGEPGELEERKKPFIRIFVSIINLVLIFF